MEGSGIGAVLISAVSVASKKLKSPFSDEISKPKYPSVVRLANMLESAAMIKVKSPVFPDIFSKF